MITSGFHVEIGLLSMKLLILERHLVLIHVLQKYIGNSSQSIEILNYKSDLIVFLLNFVSKFSKCRGVQCWLIEFLIEMAEDVCRHVTFRKSGFSHLLYFY